MSHKGAGYGALTNWDGAGWPEPDVKDAGFIHTSTCKTADMICHRGARNAKKHISCEAGSEVELIWGGWPSTHIGAMITYVAYCGEDCSTVDKTKLRWTKIEQAGLITVNPPKWALTQMIENGYKWTVTLPPWLKRGKWVMRHEAIAIPGAHGPDGAQHIPQCISFDITGNGTEVPPGTLGTELYDLKDPGLRFDDRKKPFKEYPFPGPALYEGGSYKPESDDKSSGSEKAPDSYDAPSSGPSLVADSTGNNGTAEANGECVPTTVTVTVTQVSHPNFFSAWQSLS